MAELSVYGPFDESDGDDDFGTHPVGAQPRQAVRPRERRLRDLDRVKPAPQIEQQLRVEAGANLTCERELSMVVVADQQRAQSDAGSLRIGETADDEVMRELALHLQPALRAPMFVD